MSARRIVFSVRFSLAAESTPYATQIALTLKDHPSAKDAVVYFPNVWMKDTCDDDWTNINHPCRGTEQECGKYLFDEETGAPIEKQCCWRSSYRYQLQKAKETGGYMVQVAEFDEVKRKHVLGNGQQIETEIAAQVGVKVFLVYQKTVASKFWRKSEDFGKGGSLLVDELMNRAESWLESDRKNMSVEIIVLDTKIIQSDPPELRKIIIHQNPLRTCNETPC